MIVGASAAVPVRGPVRADHGTRCSLVALHEDRDVLVAYCQAYVRWVEAEKKLAETPVLLNTPAG